MKSTHPWAMVSPNYAMPIGYPRHATDNRKKMDRGKKLEYYTKQPDISIVGINKITDPHYWWFGRISWFLILTTFTGLCIWQLWNCTANYFAYRTMKDIAIVRSSKVTFPAIYLCPGFMRGSFRSMFGELLNNCLDQPDCSTQKFEEMYGEYMKTKFPQPSVHLENLWNLNRIYAENIHVYISCDADVDVTACHMEGHELQVNTTETYSFWGMCLMLDTAMEQDYRGPFTFITIVYNNSLHNELLSLHPKSSEIMEHRVGLLLGLHHKYEPGRPHQLFFSAQDILQGFMTNVEIRKTEFEALTRHQEPCVNDNSASDCLEQCIEKTIIEKTKDMCRLPFIQSNLKECTFEASFLIYKRVYGIYTTFNLSDCKCHPTCKETVFTATLDFVDKMPDNSTNKIKFFFADNTHETTKEKLSYQFSAYFSDVGGNLGFFIGFCSLTIVELMEYIVYFITKPKNKQKCKW